MPRADRAPGPSGFAHPVWIDLDNAPHAVFFAPLVAALRERGVDVLLTARDVNNTPELARRLGLDPEVSGAAFGANRFAKVLGTFRHAVRLARAIRNRRPLLAVSHGSRAQSLAAALLRVPVVLFFDYEGSDLRAFKRVARRVYYPARLERAGDPWPGPGDLKRPYPGLKEHLALLNRANDPDALARAGIPIDRPFAVLRPESDTAHYLPDHTDVLLLAAIRKVKAWGLVPVLIPRSPSQRSRLGEVVRPLGDVVIPTEQVNGIDLLSGARLLISGGGTMNREAVVLGVPCISIFRGRVGSIDASFIAEGSIVHATTPDAIDALENAPPRRAMAEANAEAVALRDWIADHLVADAAAFTS